MDSFVAFLTISFNVFIAFKPFFLISVDSYFSLVSPKVFLLSSMACSFFYLSVKNQSKSPFLVVFFSLLSIFVIMDDTNSNNLALFFICIIATVFRVLDGFFVVNGLEQLSKAKRFYCLVISILFFHFISKSNPTYLIDGSYKFYLALYSIMFYLSIAGCYSVLDSRVKCRHFGSLSVFFLHFFSVVSLFYIQSNLLSVIQSQYPKLLLEPIYTWSFFVSLTIALILKILKIRIF
ncbi:hypothetical protein [Cellvibrio sp. UBA7661]|uniref:hypothetical protein n=1 Tax=Cellvibrio sp. UBA7661 TaxID=1946311 RepID=UPI002F359CE7